MNRFAEDAATRMVQSLSRVIGHPLTLVREPAAADDRTMPVTADLAIRGSRAFDDLERALLRDVTDVLREEDLLESRVAQLQKENLELLVSNRVLSEVSSRDALTGLYNRWYVLEKIDREMNRSARHGSAVSVLMLDIDHFKRINDSFGHPAGDEVLRSFGQLLRESCRVYDVPGRYGGEEFCVVLPETPVGSTPVIAERIRSRLATRQFEIGAERVAITASIGIAGLDSVAEEGMLTAAALVERADRALYVAKNRGRDRIETWSRQEMNH